MVVAVGLFSMMDAVMKALTATYPATQVAAMRGLSAMPLVCLYVLWRTHCCEFAGPCICFAA